MTPADLSARLRETTAFVTALCHGAKCDGCCAEPRIGCPSITKKKGKANG